MSQCLAQPVSVLMPVCNEAAIIEAVVTEWDREVFRHLPAGSELVFDDGDSRDGTLEILERLQLEHPYIRVLYSKREGFAAAARRLYSTARCPLIFFTDSDGQYVAREFWKVATAFAGHDMAHGAKVARKDPAYRKVASACFNVIATSSFSVGFRDINSAFRLMTRDLVDTILPQTHCMPTLLNAEMLLRASAHGYRVAQVDVEHRVREHGVSRGLPAATFARECVRAYRGLRELRRELHEVPAIGRPIPAPDLAKSC